MRADPKRARRRSLKRRRWSIGALALLALAAGLVLSAIGVGHTSRPAPAHVLLLHRGAPVVARLELAHFERGGRLDTQALTSAALGYLPPSGLVTRGAATIYYRYDPGSITRRIAHLRPTGGAIDISPRAISADIRAPATAQVKRNDCEATALSILLRTSGLNVDQLAVQSKLPTSQPLDPSGDGPKRVWGDPDLGFVGRADGDGPSGGFGVYPGPVRKLALAYGRHLTDLTHAPASALYQRILSGHAVMAWIGLADGPYDQWRSARGRPIRVNFGEHTIVLTGVAEDGSLTVKNPLQGTTDHWSRAKFEAMWALLGHRALAA